MSFGGMLTGGDEESKKETPEVVERIEAEKEAIKNAANVTGMTLASPPRLSKSEVPAFFSTAPAEKNSEDF